MNKTNDVFIWPEYKTDKERIRAISRKYKNVSITEAFEQEYQFKSHATDEVKEVIDSFIPIEPNVGDVFEVRITDVTKNKVVFDNINLKNDLISKVNLYKYKQFQNFTPKHPVKVLVTGKSFHKIVVDPIAPLLDDWLSEYVGGKEFQKTIGEPKLVKIRNLKLTKGGFLGDVVVDNISSFIGEEYTIPAFIPGSQIVLNIAEDFESFIGKDVDAFVVNYLKNPITSEISVICSVKEYYKFLGECNMIEMFNSWCDGTEYWKMIENTTYDGKVTGIINSSKKCGIFVEIPSMNITGLVSAKPEELVNYKPHSDIKIKISGFDEETYYNQTVNQLQHVEPYIINDGVLVKCNLKPILVIA